MDSEREIGKSLVREVMGDQSAAGREKDAADGVFGAFVAEHALTSCWGSIWSRPGLDLRSRSIATIGMVMALGDAYALKNHVRAGLRLGIAPREIEEIAYQAIPYLGYPLAGVAVRTIRETFAEDGIK